MPIAKSKVSLFLTVHLIFILAFALSAKAAPQTQLPEIELTNIKINGTAVADAEMIESTYSIDLAKEGGIRVTGTFASPTPITRLRLSLDGGAAWSDLEAKPDWSYLFKPAINEEYRISVKAVLPDGREVNVKGYPKRGFRFVNPSELLQDPQDILEEMVQAYESKSLSGFISHVSDDFPNRGELEEFVRRDFHDYDGIKINLYVTQMVKVPPDGFSVKVDWDMQFFPTSVSHVINLTGQNLDLVFVKEGGELKLQKMRGANPLFGARSPDVAVAAGVSASVGRTLQTIEDEGTHAAKASAMGRVASSGGDTADIPVTLEIVSVSAFYDDGGEEAVNFSNLDSGRPVRPRATVRITDNPQNITLTNVRLEVTDNSTSTTVSAQGNIAANQQVVLTAGSAINISRSVTTGTLTFVLDPENEFITIHRDNRTYRQTYDVP